MNFSYSASIFTTSVNKAPARGIQPVNPAEEPQRNERTPPGVRAEKSEKAFGYERPEPPAQAQKARVAAKRLDAMLGAMRDLRSRSASLAESPTLMASAEGGALTAWDEGSGAQLQSMKVDYAAMSTGKGAGQALIAQAVYQTDDGARIEASFSTVQIEGYGEITLTSITMTAPEDGPAFHESGAGDPLSVIAQLETGSGDDAVNAQADVIENVQTGDGDDAVNLRAQLLAQFDAGGGNDVISVSAQMGVDLFAGLGDDIMHVTGDYLRNIGGDGGDDIMLIEGRDVSGVFGGAGDDSIHVLGESGQHVNGGAGDDIIALWSQTGSLDVTPGGGKDIVTLGEDGDYAVNISPELAQSAEDVGVEDLGGGAVRLSFKDGSQTTLMGVDKAGGLKIGNDGFALDVKAMLAGRKAAA